jgi:hypothetical protein
MQQTMVLTPPISEGRYRVVGRRTRRGLRNVMIGAASFAVVVVAASYVLMPGGEAVATTVQTGYDPHSTGAGHSFKPDYRDCPVSHHGSPSRDSEVIYGSISGAKGVKVSNVTVDIEGTGRQSSHDTAEINVGRSGTYRAVVHLPAGPYQVTVRLVANGHRVQDTKSIRLVDERAYDVSAVARDNRVFSVLPVSSY